MRTLTKKFFILVLSLISRTYLPYAILGLINWRTKVFRSIFFCYSGNAAYSAHYCYQWTAPFLNWHPTPIGLFRQGRAWGIVFASPISESDFQVVENFKNLLKLISRLDLISRLLRVPKISLAGILPSFLEKKGVSIRGGLDNQSTAKAVYESLKIVCRRENIGNDVPVILLGGHGKLGRVIQTFFNRDERNYLSLDPVVGMTSIPSQFKDRRCIVIDVSRYGVLEKYIHDFQTGSVIINETFPEPSQRIQSLLKSRNIKLYHVAGVAGKVYPSLPLGYQGSLPCCAIHDDSHHLSPTVKKLV